MTTLYSVARLHLFENKQHLPERVRLDTGHL